MPSSAASRPYHVNSAEGGETLVSLLRRWQGNLSWGAARQLLHSRRVSVNGALCLDVGRRVRTGDVVHVHPHSRTPQPTTEDVEVLYWDTDVVVVVKPALMTTLRHHEERNWPASRKNLQPTLDECLPRLLHALESGSGESASRPAKVRKRDGPHRSGSAARASRRNRPPRVIAVHRLDRDTSGVMVFARHPAAERNLVEQFKVHAIDRTYRAVVFGHPEAGTIRRRLIRDRGDGLRGGTDSVTEGEDAVTHIRLLEPLGDYSLVECRLETGRTHQIRIHLSEQGHLVCGDPLYHRRLQQPPFEDASGAPRLALHAVRLAFIHPRTNERLEFEADLPHDLQRFVRNLQRTASHRCADAADENPPAEQPSTSARAPFLR